HAFQRQTPPSCLGGVLNVGLWLSRRTCPLGRRPFSGAHPHWSQLPAIQFKHRRIERREGRALGISRIMTLAACSPAARLPPHLSRRQERWEFEGSRGTQKPSVALARGSAQPSARLTRSGVNGVWRSRAPVSSAIALPIAGATSGVAIWPAPVGWLSV